MGELVVFTYFFGETHQTFRPGPCSGAPSEPLMGPSFCVARYHFHIQHHQQHHQHQYQQLQHEYPGGSCCHCGYVHIKSY